MGSSSTSYKYLADYLNKNQQLNIVWSKLSDSFSGEIMEQIGKYQKDPYYTLPPVYRFKNNQRDLYREIFQHLDPTYRALAILTLGFPFQEKDNTRDSLDLLLWADLNTKWDFNITGLPRNPMDILRLSFKHAILDAEAGRRQVNKLNQIVEELEKKYK